MRLYDYLPLAHATHRREYNPRGYMHISLGQTLERFVLERTEPAYSDQIGAVLVRAFGCSESDYAFANGRTYWAHTLPKYGAVCAALDSLVQTWGSERLVFTIGSPWDGTWNEQSELHEVATALREWGVRTVFDALGSLPVTSLAAYLTLWYEDEGVRLIHEGPQESDIAGELERSFWKPAFFGNHNKFDDDIGRNDIALTLWTPGPRDRRRELTVQERYETALDWLRTKPCQVCTPLRGMDDEQIGALIEASKHAPETEGGDAE